jgi:hypothetical protein
MGTLLNVMFAGEHPVLTFFLAMFVYSLTIRVLRAAVVAIRGFRCFDLSGNDRTGERGCSGGSLRAA